jgi:hypothetical protein
MILNPEAQAKAQAEIDTVVGCDRLPGFDDRESLPYIEAIYRELLRFRPPTPCESSFCPYIHLKLDTHVITQWVRAFLDHVPYEGTI